VSTAATSGTTAPGARRERLLGVDAARGAALLGMMATHVLPPTGADGEVTWPFLLLSGRAAALFAVLAGVGLALSTGRERPPTGAALAAARRGVLARAGVVAAVGLTLGLVPGPIAIILVDYGLLFAVAALFLGLRARALAVLAAGWLLAAPVLGHLLRPELLPGPGPVPSWWSLATPLQLLGNLVLTGYYPVLQWTGYLLAGLAVGRLALGRARVAAGVLGAGAALAVGSALLSDALVRAAGGVPALVATVPASFPVRPAQMVTALQDGLYGTTPTTSWLWLAVRAPHSGTPLDLLHTTGTALAVLGLCLLVVRTAAGARALVLLAAPGSMTLTLYSLHVVLLPAMEADLGPVAVWVLSAAGAVAVGLGVRALGARGPLEELAASASRAAAGSASVHR